MLVFGSSREAQKLGGVTPQAAYVSAGWGATGVFVRVWALGLQQRPLLYKPHIHVVFFAVFAGIGAVVHNFERRQLDKLELARDKLVKRRMMRDQATAAAE
ncbi:hypothetical protein SeMB42_g00091 [Synchytrium endobioticum]|uniref:Uncharacterized protein n=1 Tax=Synchytrium endobioticum TaxID=286115 RepID=A0A507DK36_9FUNG|nr:hypothetical protein SeLEV6574_g00179 [Synchytrium endobioticum]TPX54862.1 hypothetical protein SeMB42_g00091 [Synchytrium endobioticum]